MPCRAPKDVGKFGRLVLPSPVEKTGRLRHCNVTGRGRASLDRAEESGGTGKKEQTQGEDRGAAWFGPGQYARVSVGLAAALSGVFTVSARGAGTPVAH